MLPYQMIAGGNFTLTTALIASGLNVECVSQKPPDFVIARAITSWGKASTAGAVEWWWEKSMGNGYANGILQSSEGSTPQLPAMTAYRLPATGTTAVDAISCYDTNSPPTFSALATTAITSSAGTYIVSMASTGTIAVGDFVKLYSTTGALQLSGMSFQVTAVTTNVSITLGYIASSGITTAADATAGFVVKYIPGRFYPRHKGIVNITKASQAVISFASQNNYTPGEIIGIRVPRITGGSTMTEIDNKEVRVLSVTNSATVSSVTVDLDTTGYTTFALPTSAQAVGGAQHGPSMVVPSASGVIPNAGSATQAQQPPGTNLLDSFDDRNVRLIRFGAALWNVSAHTPTNGDVWSWQAYKYDDYKVGNNVWP